MQWPSATGLFNGYTLKWEEDVLEQLGFDPGTLSTPVPPTELLQGMNTVYAPEMGIPEDLPFAVGSA
jgi:gluconokinase